MAKDQAIAGVALGKALHGTGAHFDTRRLFSGLDWRRAGVRPAGAPHSVYEMLNHMRYWQEWVVKWLDGRTPPVPKHASGSWPGRVGPASRAEWNEAVRRFRETLDGLEAGARGADLTARTRRRSRLEMLHLIASHNSYHAGQVVLLRQLVGAWPPPGGGLTW